MAASNPKVKVNSTASKGEVLEIKTLISHDMETGRRKDAGGNLVPRQIINKFTCTFNGKPVFEADLQPAISANPYLSFFFKATESGTFKFTWAEDGGAVTTQEAKLEVK